MPRALRACCVLLAAISAFPAAADMSPEMYQLAWEIRRNFESDSTQATRGPYCKEDCFKQANEALRDMLKQEALTRVIVTPLEDGAKLAAGALGVPGVAIATYSMVQCYLNESTQAGFKHCMTKEIIGALGGEGLEKVGGWEKLSAGIAGVAWDKAYGEIRSAVDGYQAKSEIANHDSKRDCQVHVWMQWDRTRRPGANGGRVNVHFTFQECRCPTGSSVKRGSLSFSVPINLAPAGSNQPGWSAGKPEQYKVRITCCNQRRTDDRIHLYDSSFKWKGLARFVDDDEEQPPQPPQPPKPPTPPPPPPVPDPIPPPEPEWSEENPCPQCQPFLDAALRHERKARELGTQIEQTKPRLNTNRFRQEAARDRIARLEREIAGKAGEGGSAYDPETGITVDSWTQADGSVKVTVKDKDGNVLEERTRKRGDTNKLRKQVEQEQADLKQLEAEGAQLKAELDRLTRGRETELKLEKDAREALADCVREKCRSGVALLDDQKPKACTFPAVQAIAIGPRAQFGEKSVEQKAQDKAMGVVGDLVGGAIGGGGLGGFGKSPKKSSSGGGKQGGPDTVKDPIKNKQEFISGGTRIKTGLGPDPKGGTRVSVDVKDSPAQGAVHTIHRETLDENCNKQVQMPSDYWLYKIWLDWKLTVTWTKDTYVDNQLVKHEEGGWQEQGTTMLDSGIFDASKDIPYTAWGQLGFDRPFAGPREVGATFKDVQSGVRERYVIHVSEPQNDPVMTVPFVVYPVRNAEGGLELRDTENDTLTDTSIKPKTDLQPSLPTGDDRGT